ncbi:MAG: ASKHA domain-containing protein, partial [Opitutaceae bacterium]|nr:ASKHA domain-containing protein [Opitutaceae bacterium]
AAGRIHSTDTGEDVGAPATIKACRHTLAILPPPGGARVPRADEGRPRPSQPAGGGTPPASLRDADAVILEIPARALLRHEPAIVSNFKINIPRALDPLAPPPASPAEPWLGAAVDLGTTTVALLLCDLRTGAVLATASAFNAQVSHGEDVLTRVNLCASDPQKNLPVLQAAAAGTIQQLLEKACAAASAGIALVRSLVVAGNTVMLHLLAGVDPSPIGIYPFTPPFLEHRRLAPAALGLSFGGSAAPVPQSAASASPASAAASPLSPQPSAFPGGAEVHLLPSPAAYVGADLSAGILVTGLLHDDGPALLVDVGTNGEIILKHGPRLLGCATAAGPAFEGAGLTSGMRAVDGVIEDIRFSRDPFAQKLSLIGGEKNTGDRRPVGICGSAYVDFLAEGRRSGLLNERGRFASPPPPGAEASLVAHDGGRAFVLDPRGRSGPVLVSEHDIARLLQAKAAVAAGITTLLGIAGLAPADIRALRLAGGFGMHLDLANAIACGLLPGFEPAQIEVVGNTSLGGALAVLQDRELLPEIARACGLMESVELNLQPGFEDTYIDQLALL